MQNLHSSGQCGLLFGQFDAEAEAVRVMCLHAVLQLSSAGPLLAPPLRAELDILAFHVAATTAEAGQAAAHEPGRISECICARCSSHTTLIMYQSRLSIFKPRQAGKLLF